MSLAISLVNNARLKSFCDSNAYSSTNKLKALFANALPKYAFAFFGCNYITLLKSALARFGWLFKR